MYKVKKINILSLAYTVTLIYFVIGLCLGIFLAVLRSNNFLSSFVNQDLLSVSLFQIAILYPVAYGVGGFAMGVIIGYIYNKVSKMTGGVSIQLVKDKKKLKVRK